MPAGTFCLRIVSDRRLLVVAAFCLRWINMLTATRPQGCQGCQGMSKNAAWEASGVFFPTTARAVSGAGCAGVAHRTVAPHAHGSSSRTSSPTGEANTAETMPPSPAFISPMRLPPLFVTDSNPYCPRVCPLRPGAASPCIGRARLAGGFVLKMSSKAASVPSWDDLYSGLPINKRRAADKKAKDATAKQPLSPAAAAAAAYVGAGASVAVDIILSRDAEGISPGSRRVLLTLLEKGVEFQEVISAAPAVELVLGDRLLTGWESCVLALEETVLQVPLLPVEAERREAALTTMHRALEVVPDDEARSPWGTKQRQTTMAKLQELEELVAATDGAFALGDIFSLVDVAIFPFLDACDLQAELLVPALKPSSNPAFPALQAWYSAMNARVASYRSRVKGDIFSAARLLAVEDPSLADVASEGAARVLVEDNWKDVMAEDVPPAWNLFSERYLSVSKTPKGEAAAYLYFARDALKVEAGLAVPECVNGARRPRVEGSLAADSGRKDMVDLTLRLLMFSLVEAPEYAQSPTFANTLVRGMIEAWDHDELTEAKELLLYLRECVWAPRDMGELPARRWRAHTSWLGAQVRSSLKKKVQGAAADAPKPLRSRY